MGSKDFWPRRARSGDYVDSRFERLRQKFYRRLCADQEQLHLLNVELQRMKFDAQPTYERIRVLAHRICGAAALYEDVAICEVAGELERAAVSAIRICTVYDHGAVGRALRAMLDILSMMPAGAKAAAELSSRDGRA